MLQVMPVHVLILLDVADMVDMLEEKPLVLDYNEEGLELDKLQWEPPLPYGATQGPGSTCDACHYKFMKLQHHVVQQHLPWYLQPQTACWTCGRQPGQALYSQVHQQDLGGSTEDEFGCSSFHVTFTLLVMVIFRGWPLHWDTKMFWGSSTVPRVMRLFTCQLGEFRM